MGSTLDYRPRSYSVQLHPASMMATTHRLADPAQAALHHHDPDLSLQKYLLLQSQHESLLHHLDEMRSPTASQLSPPVSPAACTSSHPCFAPPPPAPSRRHHARRTSPPSQRTAAAAASPSASAYLETILDETTVHLVAAEEQKLSSVNEGIKRTLTELLNCDKVKGNPELRMLVQSRLMDAERELRSGRRKRTGPC